MQRLLDYEDEVVALVCLLLDRHCLHGLEATFAESLYGLKRERWIARGLTSSSPTTSRPPTLHSAPRAAPNQQQQQQQGAPLGRSGEVWALLCGVLLPYLQAKAERLFARNAAHGVLGLALRRAAAPVRGASSSGGAWVARLQQGKAAALALFVRAYPVLHAGIEAAKFGYQLAYLLDVSDYHSPVMRLLGQRLVRMSAPEMVSQ